MTRIEMMIILTLREAELLRCEVEFKPHKTRTHSQQRARPQAHSPLEVDREPKRESYKQAHDAR